MRALGWNRQETAAKRDNDSTISIFVFLFLSLVQTVEMSFKRWGPRPNVFAYSFQLEKKRVNWCVNPWGIGTDGIEYVAGLKVQKIRSVYSAFISLYNPCVEEKRRVLFLSFAKSGWRRRKSLHKRCITQQTNVPQSERIKKLKERRSERYSEYVCVHIYSASIRYARKDIDLIWPKREPQYTRLD